MNNRVVAIVKFNCTDVGVCEIWTKNSKNLKYYLKKQSGASPQLACEDEENYVYWMKHLA